MGELSLTGQLTNAQTATANRIGEIYRRVHRFRGIRATAKSANLEQGFGSAELAYERLSENELESFEASERAATQAWQEVDDELAEIPRNVRQAVMDVCVFDTAINPLLYNDLRMALDRIATRWGERRRRPKALPSSAIRAIPSPRTAEAAPKRSPKVRWDAIEGAFTVTLKILRPDLDAAGLRKAAETFLALADRHAERSARLRIVR